MTGAIDETSRNSCSLPRMGNGHPDNACRLYSGDANSDPYGHSHTDSDPDGYAHPFSHTYTLRQRLRHERAATDSHSHATASDTNTDANCDAWWATH